MKMERVVDMHMKVWVIFTDVSLSIEMAFHGSR